MSPLSPLSPLPRARRGWLGGCAAGRALRCSGVPPALRGRACFSLSTSMPSSMFWLSPGSVFFCTWSVRFADLPLVMLGPAVTFVNSFAPENALFDGTTCGCTAARSQRASSQVLAGKSF